MRVKHTKSFAASFVIIIIHTVTMFIQMITEVMMTIMARAVIEVIKHFRLLLAH